MCGGIDRVYILAQDDDIGLTLPANVQVINMSGQDIFPESGPNYYCRWTHMSLMQAALHRILPAEDKVLSLCVDTLITHDLSELWEIPLDDYYFAGVPEPYKTMRFGYTYINCGVVLNNLRKLRDGMGDCLIDSLNRQKYDFANQSCVNSLCHDHIYCLPNQYNATYWTGMPSNAYIRHFAAEGDSWFSKDPMALEFRRSHHPVQPK